MRSEPSQMINPKALQLWRIYAAFSSLFLWAIAVGVIIAAVSFSILAWVPIVIIPFVLIMTILNVVIIPRMKYKKWRYEVDDYEIELQYGVFIIRRVLIPMIRVQHVDTKQGPLLKHYGLSSVTISTAATVHEIPALSNEIADTLRNRISVLARVTEDDV
jgi:membrane protein YdbS with pleckstrin-like domain